MGHEQPTKFPEASVQPFSATLATDEIQEAGPTGPSAARESRRQRLAHKLFGVTEREPVRLGRFILLDRLGEGGVGTVHIAYDPQLDRQVALKLLRTAHGTSRAHRLRLLREAQALARLSHPNVVPVHDAGILDEQVYLVMEYVKGKTLRRWVEENRPSWQEVISVYLQAGKGLAAAHHAGVIHRDFKPDNAIWGDDGRVRVLDFGLARGVANEALRTRHDNGGESAVEPASQVGLEDRLTATGAVMGTPAYMAPEQFLGAQTDARTDQFCFCASLWEALYDTRPFAGDSLLELSKSVQSGKLSHPMGSHVPGWLQQVVARGLAVAPEARWATMDQLIAALSRDPTRKRWLLGALGLGIASALGALFAAEVQERTVQATCVEAAAVIDEVWDSPARDRLRDAFQATGYPYALASHERVVERLNQWVDLWRQTRSEACLDHDLRGVTRDDTYRRTRDCLHEGQQAFASLVGSLSRGREGAIQESISAAAALASPELCADAEMLKLRPLMPVDLVDDVRAIQGELAEAVTSKRLGEFDDAHRQAQDALAQAEGVEWAPLIAQARFTHARVGVSRGEYEQAKTDLHRTYFDARVQQQPHLAVESAILLAHITGFHQMRVDDGMLWAQLATAELAEMPSPGELSQARAEQAHARMLDMRGDYREALTLYQRALGRLERAVGTTHPSYGNALNNLAVVHAKRGAYAEARDMYESSLEITEKTYGPGHPRAGRTLENLGFAMLGLGETEQARLVLRRNIHLNVEAFGWDHTITARAILAFGALLDKLGDLPEAREYYELAISILDSLEPRPSIELERAHSHLGELRMREPVSLSSLAEARAAFTRALALSHEDEGYSSEVFFPLEGLANVEYALGRHAASLDFCERALAAGRVNGEHVLPPVFIEQVRFLKSRVLWDMGEQGIARGVAGEALERLHALGPEAAPLRDEISAWVQGHASQPVSIRD